MKRVRLQEFKSNWDEISGWAEIYCRMQEWRVRPEQDYNDLLQEAYLRFLKVRKHYSHITDKVYFYNLVRRSIMNYVTDRGKRRTRNEVAESDVAGENKLFIIVEGQQQQIDVALSIESAPKLIKWLLDYFVDYDAIVGYKIINDAPNERVALLESRRQCIRKGRKVLQGKELLWEIVRRGLCKQLGQDHQSLRSVEISEKIKKEVDLPAMLKYYITGENECIR